MDDKLQIAVELHQAGKLGEAEAIYRQILQTFPRHPDALHLLGVLAGQCGHADAGIDLIRKAIDVRSDFREAWSNLGRLLADTNQLDDAKVAYRRVTALNPSDGVGWYALTVVLHRAGQDEEAFEAAKTTVRLAPRMPEAHFELGGLYRAKKCFDDALACQREAVLLNPKYADAFNSIGNILTDLHKQDDATVPFRRAVELKPDSALFLVNLGNNLRQRNLFDGALQAYNRAIAISPADHAAHSGRGSVLSELAVHEEALLAHQSALDISPMEARYHEAMAEAYRAKGDYDAAIQSFNKALEIDPTRPAGLIGLGVIARSTGDFSGAKSFFERAQVLSPDDPNIIKFLTSIGEALSEREIGQLRESIENGKLTSQDSIAAGFALGKLLDESDQFDEAFERYSAANRRRRAELPNEGTVFDAAKLHGDVDKLINRFTVEFFRARVTWGDATDGPVFVVGMPRSGTTLVEQIAASHPDVFGAGELTDIGLIQTAMGDPAGWSADTVSAASARYLGKLQSLNHTAHRVVDKMPGNIHCLGLIATMFPKARVIVCKRDPRDNCLSCFFQWFSKGNIAFSYDLLDCASQSLEQDRLLEHWQKVLPNPMMTVQYEEMVADQEAQSRRLIDFLGLPWHPACLEFYNTKRAVLTASVWQVRQPIYTGSVGRWRHYEKHLGPLIKALNL